MRGIYQFADLSVSPSVCPDLPVYNRMQPKVCVARNVMVTSYLWAQFFLDIIRCPVKFMYYFKFHGAQAAFCKVIEGKLTSAVQCSADLLQHRFGTVCHTGPSQASADVIIYRRRPVPVQYLTTQEKNRPVPGRLSNSPVICKLLTFYSVSFICDNSITHKVKVPEP